MRGWRLLAAVLLVTTSLSGCIGGLDDALGSQSAETPVTPEAVEAPENATVEELENGVRLVFEDVELPLTQDIEIPEGTEQVRVTAERAGEGPIIPLLRNAETEGFRCWPALRQAWNVGIGSNATCAGLTAIDGENPTWEVLVLATPNLSWLVQVFGIGIVDEIEAAQADTVHVDLIQEASDGLAGEVNLDQLSEPHHQVGAKSTHEVKSHDGSELFVEVHKPAGGHETYPTLLISSPYTSDDRAAGGQAYETTIEDYVSRGYAVVVADVRGFARSDGCVNVWGEDEQKDQRVLVDWITNQGFSDGHVGMYGVSYPGTTPAEAAVQAPDGLDAIVSTAGVLNAYRDWHFGGVPNGENIGSPVFYQELGTHTTSPDPLEHAMDSANGYCDPTLVQRANDPRAIYDDYYKSRNLTARAGEVEAAVMVEHAYEDPNVKASMQMGWFNELDVPKLALLGHWSHQPAARADEISMRLAWMDQFVKGKDLGLADISKASISANGDRYREAPQWPSEAGEQRLWPDFGDGELVAEPGEGDAQITLDGVGMLGSTPADTALTLTGQVDEPLAVAGPGHITLDVTLEGASNAYVAAYLYDTGGEDAKLVTFGWSNLAHRNGHDSYAPVPPAERVKARLPLIPTEYTFESGDELTLHVEAVSQDSWGRYKPGHVGQLTLHGGEDGTVLELPTLPADAYGPVPTSVATDLAS